MVRTKELLLLSARLGCVALAASCVSMVALAADTIYKLGDATISASLTVHDHHPGGVSVRSSDGHEIASLPEAFMVKLGDGTLLRASDLKLMSVPQSTPFGETSARNAGKQLCFVLQGTQVDATWCLVQPTDARYLRQTLSLKARHADVPATEVALLDFASADAHVVGTVSGSPAVGGNIYYGFEHPLSKTSVEHGTVHAAIARTLPLRAGTSVTYSSVIGVAAPGQMRRDFLAYIERERPRAYAPFLHYNSWYDLGFGERYGEAGALDRVRAFGEQLVEQRHVQLDSFLFDDGWDDTHSFWQFNKGFPRVLREPAKLLRSTRLVSESGCRHGAATMCRRKSALPLAKQQATRLWTTATRCPGPGILRHSKSAAWR